MRALHKYGFNRLGAEIVGSKFRPKFRARGYIRREHAGVDGKWTDARPLEKTTVRIFRPA